MAHTPKRNSPINNKLSGCTRHVHPEDEEMQPDTLCAHLIKHHGWTIPMLLKGRANPAVSGEDAVKYMKKWHENDHKPMALPQSIRPSDR